MWALFHGEQVCGAGRGKVGKDAALVPRVASPVRDVRGATGLPCVSYHFCKLAKLSSYLIGRE